MGKHVNNSDSSANQDDQYYGGMDELGFDDDEFFEKYSKPARKKSRCAKDARRLIEQHREERELQKRLDEYCFHTDD